MFQKLRIIPMRISALDRSILSQTAAYPANTSPNATNATEVTALDLILTACYQPAAAPTASASITSGAIKAWTIDATPPDFQPGDTLQWISQSNYDNGTNVDDALSAAGMAVIGWGVFGGNLVVYVFNGGTTGATPAGYNPQFLLIRTSTNAQVD
jgi:hypothetical protein